MYKLKIRKIGNSAGVTLPKELLARLKIGEGDEVIVSETKEGLSISPYDETFEEAMKAFERSRKKYRNAFRELAK